MTAERDREIVDRIWKGIGIVALSVLGVFCLVVVIAMMNASSSSPAKPSSATPSTVDVSQQDPDCHRSALALASNKSSTFVWNGQGMDYYLSEYEACMKIKKLTDK